MSKQGYKGHVECFGAATSERGEEAVRRAQKWWNTYPEKKPFSGLKGWSVAELLAAYGAEAAAEERRACAAIATACSDCPECPGLEHNRCCGDSIATEIEARGQREDG